MKELLKSLAAFQQQCPVIEKDTKGYSYKYADLPSILKVINPILKANGLMFTQPLDSDGTSRYVTTTLYHIDTGEKIESRIDIPEVKFKGMNDFQSLGSGITYLRRYALSSILGIVSDEDTDAAGQQGGDAAPYQINKIEALLGTSSLNDKEKAAVENSIVDLTFARAEKCITYLLSSQLGPLDKGVIKQGDINKQLDLIEGDESK